MSERWTPGPWQVHGEDYLANGYTVGPYTGHSVARIHQTPALQGEANARLIAAAPEMAALLDALVEGFRVVEDSPDHSFDAAAFVARNADALLARIRGES